MYANVVLEQLKTQQRDISKLLVGGIFVLVSLLRSRAVMRDENGQHFRGAVTSEITQKC